MESRGVGADAPAPPARSAQRLVIPKKRSDGLSEAALAELRAEFGSAPLPPAAPAPAAPTEAVPASHTVAEACPFCHEPMPNPMSPALQGLVQQWVQKSRAGKVLRPTDTLAVCQRHRDEHDIIPHGRRNGWPLELDFRALRRRITDPNHRYMRVLQDRLLDPERSPFFQEARRTREHMGKRASASAHQIDRFDEQQCG